MRLRGYIAACSTILVCILIITGVSVLNASHNQKPYKLVTRRVIDFRIDSSFSIEEIHKIQSALKEWEIVTFNHVQLSSFVDDISISEVFTWRKDLYPTIYNAQSVLGWKNAVAKYRMRTSNILGVTFINSGDIFILGDKDCFRSVVLHEVGHVFLKRWHSDRETEIMYPKIGEEKNISMREAFFVQTFTR